MQKASIIITCYNLGAFIDESIESACAQTFADFEVLVVDDGSTDPATQAVITRLEQRSDIRVIRIANGGVAAARNTAIQQATGEYVLCLDADDRIHPTYVQKAIDIFECSPEVGLVGCHYQMFGERTGECRPSYYRFPELLVENVIPSATFFRRRCWEEVGGYATDINSIEDWNFWISILERGYTGHVIPEILFDYRIRPGSNLAAFRKPDVYVQRLQRLYAYHPDLYRDHVLTVLAEKDRLFAELYEYTQWQTAQAENWERATREHMQMLADVQRDMSVQVATSFWLRRQRERWKRLSTTYPDRQVRAKIIINGIARRLRGLLK